MMEDQEHRSEVAARRGRVGVSLPMLAPRALIDIIVKAETAGVEQVWLTQAPMSSDSLTLYAAALGRTERIRLGTSIVPTYPRHPLALAQQAATADALGPGRIRLGVGPSHRPVIEGVYGLPMESPLAHLREYVEVLRGALWAGSVEHQGHFFKAAVKLDSAPQVPLLISALGQGAFQLAGELSDGAISWNCPPAYLHDVALPALRTGAAAAGRAAPPLVAHAWVALSGDIDAVRAAARKNLAMYTKLPFYVNMWSAAGYPLQPDGQVSDALVDSLVASGDEAAVVARLHALLEGGLDELLLTALPLGDPQSETARLLALVGGL